MQIRRLTRDDGDFYAVMGPVFGSREVERITHDRFYDDAGKVWYVSDTGGAVSVLDSVIRNFYTKGEDEADAMLACLTGEYRFLHGIVPRQYREAFERAGFSAQEYRNNFIEVDYEAD